MDRRDFFKTLLATSLAAPLLARVELSSPSSTLYVISNSPQAALPALLEELGTEGAISGRSISIPSLHPAAEKISAALTERGWTVREPESAGVVLGHVILGREQAPSFTLIREGKILDIRAKKLHSLWVEMNRTQRPSALLTLAASKAVRPRFLPAETASVTIGGRRIAVFSLSKNTERKFRANSGCAVVRVKDGRVSVAESSCSHGVCLASGPAVFAGERIICAPNRLLVELAGARDVDTVIG